MSKIEKLEEEIKQLNQKELEEFRRWFYEFDAEAWDLKLEDDIRAGKLDQLANEALDAHKAGRSREL